MITASMLYDYISCPHRVSQDLFESAAKKDPVSPFVQLLWDRGTAHEQEVMASLNLPFLDLSGFDGAERERLTTNAMQESVPLIYSGRISHGDLLGVPDLLRLEGAGYVPGDIKSGSGEEGGDDDGKPKKHYAVQMALYVDILEKLGRSGGRRAFVWDIHGKEVPYDLVVLQGVKNPQSLWSEYERTLGAVRKIIEKSIVTAAALSSPCKNCWWHSACLDALIQKNDLTLIPELGRAQRDAFQGEIETVAALAEIDPKKYVVGKKTKFAGIGPDSLEKFQRRAKLNSTPGGKPYLRSSLALPTSPVEIFFDIEVDPMRDICYLHGFIERDANGVEVYVAHFADEPTRDKERVAFIAAWDFLRARPKAIVYYYSKYERTIYRKLQSKYPDICTPEEVEALFSTERAVDLYNDVVTKATEWPTRDYSLKTLAAYLGFKWRDTHPSGAASIEWFDKWVKTKDAAVKARIVEYNEDDCRATRVLLDGVRSLTVI